MPSETDPADPEVPDLVDAGKLGTLPQTARGKRTRDALIAAARTVFDSATVILWRDGPTDFRMDIWRSFVPHVCALLAQVQDEVMADL